MLILSGYCIIICNEPHFFKISADVKVVDTSKAICPESSRKGISKRPGLIGIDIMPLSSLHFDMDDLESDVRLTTRTRNVEQGTTQRHGNVLAP